MQANRKICLDTETTGLYTKDGERITEIGCVELINDIATGKTYQVYMNPEKPLSKESIEICGHDDAFFADKPKFAEIYDSFVEFIADSPIIAHNANFDIGFINYEFSLLGKEKLTNEVIDTLTIARKKYPGQKVNLDALCKRFNVDNSRRTYHGALLDAELLSEVYLHLIGGVEKELMSEEEHATMSSDPEQAFQQLLKEIQARPVRQARDFHVSEEELAKHEEFLSTKFKGEVLWHLPPEGEETTAENK